MAAWLTALSALTETDDDLARRARQSMEVALSGTAMPSDLFERHWSIMQTTIAALRTGDGTKQADSTSDLAGARSLFTAASEAIHAVNTAATSADAQKMDQILDAFREGLSATRGKRD